MTQVFLYGTLRHKPLLDTVLNAQVALDRLQPAVLKDHQVYWAKGKHYPLIKQSKGGQIAGLLLTDLTPDELARLDYYETGFGYARVACSVQLADQSSVSATVWWPTDGADTAGAVFDLDDWVPLWGDVNRRAAWEIMTNFGLRPVSKLAFMHGQIQARAASWHRAQTDDVPAPLSGLSRAAVSVENVTRPYANYFAMEEQILRHPRFDGEQSDLMERGVFQTADAAFVLPYDPIRDRVLLIEQFRMGPFSRGDQTVWHLESIAGRVDPGETPIESARREAVEEAGLTVNTLLPLHEGYSSPGCSTEYYYQFLGLVDLPDDAGGIGGLDDEAEDIKSHILSFDQAMDLLDQGHIRVTPLATALLWLARKREELRKTA